MHRALSPKVIVLDIETSPNIVYTWGKYEQNAIDQVKGWELLSFAYKELGAGKVKCVARPDFKDKTDKAITRAAWVILEGADVIITQNGDRFDLPKLRAKFAQYNLPPCRPFKSVDTKKIAKSHFGFFSNSLNDIARDLSIGQKMQTGGFELWKGCMAGDAKAWAKMRRYNSWDVVLLEKVYERLKAWHPSHPNLALYEDRPGCPVCSSLKVHRKGYRVNQVRKALRYQCQDCSHWFARSKALEAA
jgi:DNA polymerase elongation subunit (family B)